jgi:hypothetical protein
MNRPSVLSDAFSALALHDGDAPTRPGIERFIQERFAAVHEARVRDFLPTLVSTHTANRELLAAAGFQKASDGTLFLESYLKRPVENCVSTVAGTPVSRRQIVEIGNLATARTGSTRKLIILLAFYFAHLELDWAVLTLTPTLINSFTRLGIELHTLAKAEASKLYHSGSDWGRYYDCKPMVVAANIPLSTEHLLQRGQCSTLLPTPVTTIPSAGTKHHDPLFFH